MAITGSKIATVSDSAEPARIQPSDLQPFGAPAVPAHKDFWWAADESITGEVTFTLNVNWNGTTYVLMQTTYPV